ncbi:helix-turn-helix domain-containing protein [Endozoicomonas sp. OPT23]|uniref:helix-turn-helix domain-containing protein n=1 Tax=Endozoicomonas sp. OPT23 TaxID=2072845 RepID=UPI00129AD066|nr:helix-turn-helix domain-containing protein [Endozoicomonas sp. OPT23]
METQLAHVARSLFKYYSGDTSLEQVRPAVSRLFAQKEVTETSTTGTPLGSRMKEFLASMKAEPVVQKWKDRLESDEELSDEEAQQFLVQVFNTLENDQRFFNYQNVAGDTHFVRDTWNDYIVLRPEAKAGWTIHVTLEGSGTYNCVRTAMDTKPGDIMLFSPTAYLDARRSENSEEWAFCWTMFQADSHIMEMLNWPEVASGIHHIKAGSSENLKKVKDVIDFMSSQGWSVEPAEVKARAICIELLMQRCNQIIESGGYHRIDSRVQTAVRFIEDNLFSDLCIEKIAEAACLSPSALSLLFKKHCGVSVMQWREEKRMAEACNKLIHTSKRIIQIADELGYVNQMYFSRCFRKQMKMSPSEYRKKHSS